VQKKYNCIVVHVKATDWEKGVVGDPDIGSERTWHTVLASRVGI